MCMFNCGLCGGTTLPRTPAARVVVRRREKQYPYRHAANVFFRPASDGKVKERKTDDPGGVGWEIAREVLACPDCAVRFVPQRE
ncbi:MAG TPA: hypothetical protein VKE74_13395 [Gemmataceae bacterium]|nr:hypothetical protein [Gemmataceae bacterium]